MSGLRILMYHAVGWPGEDASRFVVPVERFERQMAWLERARYRVLPLVPALEALRAGEELPARALAITFDDGTADVVSLAPPILERFGFTATVFVVTGVMGGTIEWNGAGGLRGRRLMAWSDAASLPPSLTLAPHSRTHPSLPTLDDEMLDEEIRGSRDELAAHAGHGASVFAYPFGHYDARIAAAVGAAGYSAACTVISGVNRGDTPPHELRRYEVWGDEPLVTFGAGVAVDAVYQRVRRARRFRDRRRVKR